MTDAQKYAFKCKNCGHLEDVDAAGENTTPAACRNCGAGVTFDPRTGIKTYDADNWIVLDELSDTEQKKVLKFHGIEESQIEAPPAAPEVEPEPEG